MCKFLAKISKFIWQSAVFVVFVVVSIAIIKTIF